MSDFAMHSGNDAGNSGIVQKAIGMCLSCVALSGAFFLARITAHNLYCLGRVRLLFGRIFYVLNLRGRVAGGLSFWRGNVFAGGVCKQGMAGVNVEQSGGALRGAVVEGGKGGKDGSHFVPRVRRARRLVVAAPGWDRYALPTCLRQRMVDALGVLPAQINHAGEV